MSRGKLGWTDALTAGVKRAADLLFLINPKGTSVGVVFGVTLDGILKIFAPTFSRFSTVVNIAAVKIYYCIAAGILLFNIPTLFKRRELPKEIEDALVVIQQIKGQLPEWQVRMQYLALASNVVERLEVRTTTPRRRQRRLRVGSTPR